MGYIIAKQRNLPRKLYWNKKNTWKDRIFDIFNKRLDGLKPESFLDAGCSWGATTNDLKKIWPDAKAYGIDRSVKRIEKAKSMYSKEDISFSVMDAFKSDFEDDSFGCVLMLNNLMARIMDVNYRDAKRAVSAVTRLIKDDGQFIVSIEEDWRYNSYMIFTKDKDRFYYHFLADRCINVGFDIVVESYDRLISILNAKEIK